MNDYWENNYRNMVTENDTLTARIEALEAALRAKSPCLN